MTTTKSTLTFNVPLGSRLLFFFCIAALCFVINSVIFSVIVSLRGESTSVMRVLSVIQDIFVFIVPAIATAIIVTRLPARFLAIDNRPRLLHIVLAAVSLVGIMPLLNVVTIWNEGLSLPEGLAGVEEWMRNAEQVARGSIDLLFGGNTVGSLIVTLLIVAVMAGFSEELFYRGALQRLLSTGGLNIHVAIWLAAIIFSGMHLQFYGFFPRLMLGAFFGYILYWTQCLWIPVIIHILNNALYIINVYNAGQMGNADAATDVQIPVSATIGAAAAAAVALYLLWRSTRKKSEKN